MLHHVKDLKSNSKLFKTNMRYAKLLLEYIQQANSLQKEKDDRTTQRTEILFKKTI